MSTSDSVPSATVKYTPEADQHLLDVGLWWLLNRPKNPWLFEESLDEALEYLKSAPEAPKVHLIKKGLPIRRYLLKTGHHIYYHYDRATNTIRVGAISGGSQKEEPDLSSL
jgi:plasmid stabilization system protein ParE